MNLNFEEFRKKCEEYKASEEYKIETKRIIDKMNQEDSRKERWLKWLETNDTQFEHIMSKLDEERHTNLKWLIYDYVSEIGEYPTRKQSEAYSNQFTHAIYVYKNYLFNFSSCQGGHLDIEKL